MTNFSDYGLFCCICFEFLDEKDCYEDEFGKWDMCKPCGELEAFAALTLFMSGGRNNK